MFRLRITAREFHKNDWQKFNAKVLGVGIRGMRERVRQSGGELTIDSNASGTKIVAIFPDKLPTAKEQNMIS